MIQIVDVLIKLGFTPFNCALLWVIYQGLQDLRSARQENAVVTEKLLEATLAGVDTKYSQI